MDKDKFSFWNIKHTITLLLRKLAVLFYKYFIFPIYHFFQFYVFDPIIQFFHKVALAARNRKIRRNINHLNRTLSRKKKLRALIVPEEVRLSFASRPQHPIRTIIILAVIIAALGWSLLAIKFTSINENGLKIVWNFIKYFIWPDSAPDPTKHVIVRYFLTFESYGIPYLMFETIMIAFIGTLLGAVLSIPIAFLSSRNITGGFVSWLGSILITAIRTLPIFVWGVIFIYVKGGPLAGVLAIAVSSVGMMSKMYIEAIEDIDKGILEALDSTGANVFQKIRYGVLPQLSASFLSTAIYRFEINVKNATILGMVGAGGIGFTLIDAMGSMNFGIVGVCFWGIIPVVFIIEYFSTKIRTKLTTGI